jgi:hypothetical protein
MLKKLMSYIGLGGPEYDAKILIRDAKAMVEMIHGQHGAASLRKIAAETRSRIDEVHERGLYDIQFYGRGIESLTEVNRAARARRDNIAWSGVTLAIIYIKAEMMEDMGTQAKNTVEGFMQQWSYLTE